MSSTVFLAALGGLLAIAFVANKLFRLTRVPDVIVLLTIGLLVGPVFHIVRPGPLRPITDTLGTLALILILFEGGLELNLRDTLRHVSGGVLLALLSFILSGGAVALIVWKMAGVDRISALLVGAVLGCTSGSIVLPVLQQLEASLPVRLTLVIEAALGDVLAVSAVSVLFEFSSHSGPIVVGKIVLRMAGTLLGAAVGGVLWSRLLPRLSEQRFGQAITFSIVLLLYAAMEASGRNGLLAVLVFGLTLANARRLNLEDLGFWFVEPLPRGEHHHRTLAFHSELSFLVRSFFFVMLGVVFEMRGLRGYVALVTGVMVAMIIARVLAVVASSWTWGERNWKARELALWVFPRGLITAVLAIQVLDARGPQVAFLPGLAFAAILITNLLVIVGSVRARRPAVSEAGEAAAVEAKAGQLK
jgi:Na+:H+ antiporter